MNVNIKQKLVRLIKHVNNSKIQSNLLVERMGQTITRKEFEPNEAIVIAGSGRSGTTWIQNSLAEILRYQPIFEPLNPNFVNEAKLLLGVEQGGEPVVYSPYLRANGLYPEWDTLLTQALTGNIRNYWTEKKRYTLLPKGYITKFIRANFMLGYISNNYNPKIIFVMRHPCAVIFSRMRLNWQANKSNLFYQPEIIEDYLRPYLSDIENENDPVGIHAIWWALEQLIALDELKKQNYFFTHYEDILLSNKQKLDEIIHWIGKNNQHKYFTQRQEISISDDIENKTRITQWVSGLNSDQKDKILWWANRFDINHYSNQIYPINSSA